MGYEVSVEVSKCIEEVSELILFIFFLIFSDTLPIRYRRSIGVSKYRIRIGIRVRQVSEVSVQPSAEAHGAGEDAPAQGAGEDERAPDAGGDGRHSGQGSVLPDLNAMSGNALNLLHYCQGSVLPA